MSPVDPIVIGLCALFACGGALMAIICLDAASRPALRRSWLEGYRAGMRAGRASLFPHRMGGDHG
ncbi:MAG: hypothetical protein AB1592_13300 [Pseudomonadota bacterium]